LKYLLLFPGWPVKKLLGIGVMEYWSDVEAALMCYELRAAGFFKASKLAGRQA